MSKRISELDIADSPLGDSDQMVVVQQGVTKRAAVAALPWRGLTKDNYVDMLRTGAFGTPFLCLNYQPGLGGFCQFDLKGIPAGSVEGMPNVLVDNQGGSGSLEVQADIAKLKTGATATGRMRLALFSPAQVFDAGFSTLNVGHAVRGEIDYIEARWLGEIPVASTSAQRFQALFGIEVGTSQIGLRYSDNANGGLWQVVLNNGGTVLANTSLTFQAGWDGWFRARVTPSAATGQEATVQVWLDNWNNGNAELLYEGVINIPGLGVAEDARIDWTPYAWIIKSVGTTSCELHVNAMSSEVRVR
ncbi:hypothetical protein EA796_00970 [Pseudomonas sp. AOB-7]|uniref:hypothetical protein n=1 Tax=Pseudomonas sp. AOB-7 TaxID=2482750 RepID=UPI000EFA6C92|nr:hypothetical protein [Pseudomonas sp. AOB-7]RMH86434.1 hypothetical protein EA796_00970 [Pseudomonas sp. AOB-7]